MFYILKLSTGVFYSHRWPRKFQHTNSDCLPYMYIMYPRTLPLLFVYFKYILFCWAWEHYHWWIYRLYVAISYIRVHTCGDCIVNILLLLLFSMLVLDCNLHTWRVWCNCHPHFVCHIKFPPSIRISSK